MAEEQPEPTPVVGGLTLEQALDVLSRHCALAPINLEAHILSKQALLVVEQALGIAVATADATPTAPARAPAPPAPAPARRRAKKAKRPD